MIHIFSAWPPVPPWTLDAQKELLGTESANMCVVRSILFSFVCTNTTVVIPLPFQCGIDPIPSPLGPAFASLSYLIFVIATVQLVSLFSVHVSVTSQTSWPCTPQLPANKLARWLFSLSQLPANMLARWLFSVSVTSQTSWPLLSLLYPSLLMLLMKMLVII